MYITKRPAAACLSFISTLDSQKTHTTHPARLLFCALTSTSDTPLGSTNTTIFSSCNTCGTRFSNTHFKMPSRFFPTGEYDGKNQSNDEIIHRNYRWTVANSIPEPGEVEQRQEREAASARAAHVAALYLVPLSEISEPPVVSSAAPAETDEAVPSTEGPDADSPTTNAENGHHQSSEALSESAPSPDLSSAEAQQQRERYLASAQATAFAVAELALQSDDEDTTVVLSADEAQTDEAALPSDVPFASAEHEDVQTETMTEQAATTELVEENTARMPSATPAPANEPASLRIVPTAEAQSEQEGAEMPVEPTTTSEPAGQTSPATPENAIAIIVQEATPIAQPPVQSSEHPSTAMTLFSRGVVPFAAPQQPSTAMTLYSRELVPFESSGHFYQVESQPMVDYRRLPSTAMQRHLGTVATPLPAQPSEEPVPWIATIHTRWPSRMQVLVPDPRHKAGKYYTRTCLSKHACTICGSWYRKGMGRGAPLPDGLLQ